jgi:hypothetical protein
MIRAVRIHSGVSEGWRPFSHNPIVRIVYMTLSDFLNHSIRLVYALLGLVSLVAYLRQRDVLCCAGAEAGQAGWGTPVRVSAPINGTPDTDA